MKNMPDNIPYTDIYEACRSILGKKKWSEIVKSLDSPPDPETLQLKLVKTGEKDMPEFFFELARLEWVIHEVSKSNTEVPMEFDKIIVNPSVRILELSWKNLLSFLDKNESFPQYKPEHGNELVIIWKDTRNNTVKYKTASSEDLLALKIIVDELNPLDVARDGNKSIGFIDTIIDQAVYQGILCAPESKIRRDPYVFLLHDNIDDSFYSSFSFTLQWHITQACDLHCRHCYDRSSRSVLKFGQAISILDDLREFCRSRNVMGAISFTGGNPLLYPYFFELYQEASERGLSLSILGNPTTEEQLEKILSIKKPTHFQVSLEGLPEHNDYIRGEGHFSRIIDFLKILRNLNIFSMVMVTLTKDNMHQVIPLADMLFDHADRVHFNRLSMVGEGAKLKLPDRLEYISFLELYLRAAESNPILGLKDNMLNVLRHKKGLEPFGGCTGYGCGAAFNFLVALADGEVHACRKFPSYIGNIFQQRIAEIYDSETAKRYRSGCSSCRACSIRPVCGGCLAIAYSFGLNIYEEKDPFCFIKD